MVRNEDDVNAMWQTTQTNRNNDATRRQQNHRFPTNSEQTQQLSRRNTAVAGLQRMADEHEIKTIGSIRRQQRWRGEAFERDVRRRLHGIAIANLRLECPMS